jgi:5-methylcytosine-specific restriction protein A
MRRTPSVCATPGCPELVEIGRYCRKCATKCATKLAPPSRNERWKPYNSAAWRRKSAQYRAAHPICERCRLQPSAHVDHRDGRGPDGPRGLDDSNLKALCKSCHSRKTATHDGGFGNPRKRSTA